ncbi:MAG: bacterial Ig-like domain-containing protein [Clostridia bacterium]|nr:bacterial Ig-like domain-containing protein [Clostridia bacterium]
MSDTSNSNADIIKVGELYKGADTLNSTKHFSGENLSELYNAIIGANDSKLSDINSLLSGGAQITSEDIRTNNNGKDIVVSFGGFEWTVTHLTKDKSGAYTVATLWLANSYDKHQWNKWSANTPTVDYPSSMYSSSYIRSDALNIGSGYVASRGDTTLTNDISQSSTHKYAAFTMPSVTDSLTDFIITPSQIAYQETENQFAGGSIGGVGYTMPNEAYGTPAGKVNWSNSNFNYSSKNGYTDWKEDYIWLPSLTETGYSGTITGIWALSNNQRSNYSTYYSWLRSGGGSDASNARGLEPAGNYSTGYATTNEYAVRPALHLNLTAADNAKAYDAPIKQEVTYDGQTKSIEALLDDKGLLYNDMTIVASSQVSGTNADLYTAKITLPSPYRWIQDDGNGGWTTVAGTIDYQWEIKQRKLTLTWSGISSSYVWESTLLEHLKNYKPVLANGVDIDNLDVMLTYDGSADNTKLDVAGAHMLKADIITKNSASGAAALLTQNYIMPTANQMEYTYTVQKASQLAPILSIDYEREELIPTNPTVNGQDRTSWLQYKDGGIWQPIVDMKIPESIMTGEAYSFRYKVPTAFTDYIDDSGEFSLLIPKRQSATDIAIDFEKESLGISGGYSYYIGTSAPAITDYNLTGTAVSLDLGASGLDKIVVQGQTENKVYYYRNAVTGASGAFRSDIHELLIPARRAAPELSINYKTERTAQPVTSAVTYIISGGNELKGNGNLIDLNPDSAMSKTLRAWYAADSSTFKSEEAVLTIPARPAAPVIEYDIDSEEYLNSHAPTSAMEYRASTSALWDKADENTKPRRGTYVFRYAAIEEDIDNGISGAFASAVSAVVDYGNKTISVTVKWTDNIGNEFASAYDYSGEVIKPTAVFYTGSTASEQVPVPSGLIKYVITNSAGRAESNPMSADVYKVTVSIIDATGQADSGYTISNPDFEYTINKYKVVVPTLSRDVVYNGEEQDVRQYLSDYDAQYVDTAGYNARNVSIDGYTLNIVLKNSNYEWADGRAESYINIDWNITPLERAVIWNRKSFTYDGSIKHPTATIASCNDEEVTFTYTGDINASKVHKGYSITASISRDDYNYLNYTLTEGSESVTFDIVLGVGMTLIFIEWTDGEGNAFEDGGSLMFNGEVQYPKAVIRRDTADGEEITDIVISYTDADGNPITSKWTGSYSVKISVDNTLYGIDGECLESISYNIVVDASGNGEYKIISIEIGGNYKSSYSVGEKFNASGMIVYGVYPDGERVEINVNDYAYTPQDTLADGDNTITVSYGDLSATFTVRAGEILSGGSIGDFDASNYVSKKIYIITTAALAALIMISIVVGVIIINKVSHHYPASANKGKQEADKTEDDSD